MQIPFSPPYIDNDVIHEVVSCLESGWITTGPRTRELENIFAQITSSNICKAVNSWTSGAMLALKWLGIKEGDEVIVPSFTYCATAMVVISMGAKPIMVDVDENFVLDLDKTIKAITPRTKAIMPVDYGGMFCDYNRLNKIVNSEQIRSLYNPQTEVQKLFGRIVIIADSAHSIGAKYSSQPLAKLMDISIISLHAVKNITSAEGGMICLNLPSNFDISQVKQWFNVYSLNGQTKDSFTKTQLASWQYDVVGMGLKINLPDVCASIALAQIKKYDYLLDQRKRVFDRYSNALINYAWAILPFRNIDSNVQISYHLYPLRIKDCPSDVRNEIIKYLAQKGIATNVHYQPLPMLTLFKDLGYCMNDYPMSKALYENEITLPLYPQLTNEQIDYILSTLVDIVAQLGFKN